MPCRAFRIAFPKVFAFGIWLSSYIVYALASRWVHYNYRIRRIQPDEGDIDGRDKIQAMTNKLASAKCYIDRIVRICAPPAREEFSFSSGRTTTSTEQPPTTPVGEQLNSTENGETDTVANGAAGINDTIIIQTANIVRNVRQEQEEDRKVIMDRLELTLRIVDRLHKELWNGFVREGGCGRIERLSHLAAELKREEAQIRVTSTAIPITNVELRTRISEALSQINGDLHIAEAKLMRVQQRVNGTAGAVHSTMRQTDRTLFPTVPLFTHEIDALTLNDSVRTQPQVDERPARATHTDDARVTFAPLPSQNGARESNVRTEAEPQGSMPRMSEPPTNTDYLDNHFRNARQPSEQNSNNSKQWPWPTNEREPNYYHPAATPTHTPNYGLPATRTVPTEEPAAFDNQMGQTKPMNLWQSQQFLGRILGNRRYEGDQADGTKTISTDEFVGHLRQYQLSTKLADAEVLATLSSYMMGAAFIWWKTNGREISTIDQLEVRLKARFDQMPMDYLSQILTFVERKQAVDENLCAYIDDMRQIAYRLRPTLEEEKIITRIVDNANETYRTVLASRSPSIVGFGSDGVRSELCRRGRIGRFSCTSRAVPINYHHGKRTKPNGEGDYVARI